MKYTTIRIREVNREKINERSKYLSDERRRTVTADEYITELLKKDKKNYSGFNK
jgi:hypothetical protein